MTRDPLVGLHWLQGSSPLAGSKNEGGEREGASSPVGPPRSAVQHLCLSSEAGACGWLYLASKGPYKHQPGGGLIAALALSAVGVCGSCWALSFLTALIRV